MPLPGSQAGGESFGKLRIDVSGDWIRSDYCGAGPRGAVIGRQDESSRSAAALRVLIVGDTPDDAALIVSALEAAGTDVHFERVDSAETLAEALELGAWDIVLCDHLMPRFGSERALLLIANAPSAPPAIIVSGAIGEEATVAAMRAGAVDFVSKDDLVRLPAAVQRAREEAERAQERERHEAELLRARRSEAIAVLASGVALELNSLLAVVLGFSDLVSDELGPGHPLQQQLADIHSAAEHSAALTKNLRAVAGGQTLERRPVPAAQIPSGLERTLRAALGERIELVIQDESDGAVVLGDPTQLEQALLHLALNARDAMPDGGVLTIRTGVGPGPRLSKAEPRKVRISVSDTGTGMSYEVRSRIFEPFFTTKESTRGAGLGLAAVHGIIEQTGGSVSFDSTPGRGSTFVVELPMLETPGPATEPTGAARLRD